MRKNLVSLAVLAGLTAGMGSAHAVHVNSDGLGQALIYPFYSVEGGNDTYIAIANTTDEFKAVKVRILEAMDSREVLDFNLYLSPRDHWSAVIRPTATGAEIATMDTSCTVPNSLAATIVDGNLVAGTPQAFRSFEYEGVGGLARTREGYVEIIEMGEVTGAAFQDAIEHVPGGAPGNCGLLSTAWLPNNTWAVTPTNGMAEPGGGLYGYGVLINVAEGTNATYDATALDNFSNLVIHSNPGFTTPSLSDGVNFADVIDGATVVAADFVGPNGSLNAVSAVLMHDFIMNDFVTEPVLNAGTDWVITFPTKRFYAGTRPFTATFGHPTGACEVITIDYWNREEQGVAVDPGGIDFSPLPPPDVAPALSLCFEANVLTFEGSAPRQDVLFPSSRVSRNLEVIHDNGWATIGFAVDNSALVGGDFNVAAQRVIAGTVGLDDVVFRGLPVVGFAVQKYVNGNVGGVLSNYAGLVNHKATRSILID